VEPERFLRRPERRGWASPEDSFSAEESPPAEGSLSLAELSLAELAFFPLRCLRRGASVSFDWDVAVSIISPNPGDELRPLSFDSGELRSPAFERSVIVKKRCMPQAPRVVTSPLEGRDDEAHKHLLSPKRARKAHAALLSGSQERVDLRKETSASALDLATHLGRTVRSSVGGLET
jgi:hypothetical protein